ncbi:MULTISPECIES: alternate-type signal peptide domain-containing protein [Nocardioides]|uniref:alternate-type signal peptide domain-containing protein n=1 Tax=Nocardioides TaxID=1839 RepID=UPI00187A0E84|nr:MULTISPECIES: alternate-type signal peptide domain-containing protein [Nocardioides]MCM3513729.1 alternate-type signal peptide domain-containing protein [Nocardioides sp. P86]
MRTIVKGSLAAGAGVVLLLGGAGTLAVWTDAEDLPGTGSTSGYLDLTDPVCDPWELDGGAAFTTQLIVPGDELSHRCTFTLDAAGEHLSATFETSDPVVTETNALVDDLVVSTAYTVAGVPVDPEAGGVAVQDGDVVTAVVTVSFPLGSDNASNVPTAGLQATLEDITVTATQGHSG